MRKVWIEILLNSLLKDGTDVSRIRLRSLCISFPFKMGTDSSSRKIRAIRISLNEVRNVPKLKNSSHVTHVSSYRGISKFQLFYVRSSFKFFNSRSLKLVN